MQRNFFVIVILGLMSGLLVGCQNYADIPPNDIGMMLTPTGYEEKIYTPGQVDIGQENANKRGNKMVLIQRSGIQIKEQFIGKEGNADKEDHRCLTANKAPATVDVRILLALPDYEKPTGKKDLARIFLLGNPAVLAGANPEGRVLRITADSIYVEQAQQQVRGKIRQVIMGYKDFDSLMTAFADVGETGLTKKIEVAVSTALVDQSIPLRVVSAFVSNLKPDPSVVEATSAKQAADKRVEAIKVLTDFLSEDATGARWKVYNMQVLQEIVSTANNNGHNTIFMTDISGGASSKTLPIPLPSHR